MYKYNDKIFFVIAFCLLQPFLLYGQIDTALYYFSLGKMYYEAGIKRYELYEREVVGNEKKFGEVYGLPFLHLKIKLLSFKKYDRELAKKYDRELAQFESELEKERFAVTLEEYSGMSVQWKRLVKSIQSNFLKAIVCFDKAIKLKPDYAEAYNKRGLVYRDWGAIEKAIRDFSTPIQINPNYAEAYNNRGVTYRYKRDFNSAIADFKKAIAIDSIFDKARVNLGEAEGHFWAIRLERNRMTLGGACIGCLPGGCLLSNILLSGQKKVFLGEHKTQLDMSPTELLPRDLAIKIYDKPSEYQESFAYGYWDEKVSIMKMPMYLTSITTLGIIVSIILLSK